MKKTIILSILTTLLLTGCSMTTPIGTFTYDSSITSKSIILKDEQGKTTVIPTDDLNSYLNSLLDSVALPNDTTKEDLTNFVQDSLNTLGIDINKITINEDSTNIDDIRTALEEHDIDTSDMTDEEIKIYIEDFVNQKLEEQGINTNDLNIDFSLFLK